MLCNILLLALITQDKSSTSKKRFRATRSYLIHRRASTCASRAASSSRRTKSTMCPVGPPTTCTGPCATWTTRSRLARTRGSLWNRTRRFGRLCGPCATSVTTTACGPKRWISSKSSFTRLRTRSTTATCPFSTWRASSLASSTVSGVYSLFFYLLVICLHLVVLLIRLHRPIICTSPFAPAYYLHRPIYGLNQLFVLVPCFC